MFQREHDVGPGYNLGLYTSRRVLDGAHRLFEIRGIARGYIVHAHTQSVWLGKQGWAYLDSGTNVGTTISIVREPNPKKPWRDYTYTLIFGCPYAEKPWHRYFVCLKRVATSMRHYTPISP